MIVSGIWYCCIFSMPSLRSYARPSFHPKYLSIIIISSFCRYFFIRACLISHRQRLCIDDCSFRSKSVLRRRARENTVVFISTSLFLVITTKIGHLTFVALCEYSLLPSSQIHISHMVCCKIDHENTRNVKL
jgi:hypothetical protein